MRRIVLAVALASLALASLPTPQAAPVEECVPTCTVLAMANAFTPRTVIVNSGAALSWSTPFDTVGHTATSASFCLHASWPAGSGASATFRVADGALLVKSPNRAETACPDAVAAGDGVFLLQYVCLFHPPMIGEVVVVA